MSYINSADSYYEIFIDTSPDSRNILSTISISKELSLLEYYIKI